MRDKVKRFLSILMTALMLVNLLPVGALAEGVMISNSVQSKVSLTADSGTAPIETGYVYVYVKIDGASPETLAKFKLNSSGWYTIGSIRKDMPGKGEWKSYWYGGGEWVITPTPSDTKTYQPGDNTGAGELPAYSIVGLKPWEDNKLIPLGNVRWTGYKLTTGANNYQPESIFSWHMDGIVNFKEINVPYTVKHVVKKSSPEIVLKEETKNQKYGQWTEAQALKFEGYKHVGKIENQIIGDDPITIYVYYEPDKKQTVDVTYKTSEGGTITNGRTYKIQPVTGNLSGGGRLPSSTPTAADGYEFVGWERDDGQIYNDLNDVYSKLNQKTADAGTYTLYQNTTFTAKFTKKANLSYTVKYLEKGTNKKLHDEKTASNKTFGDVVDPKDEVIGINGYNYDSASPETLTIGTDDNVLTLYYTKRTDLIYTVNYYWNETTEKVADSKTVENQTFEAEVTEHPVEAEGYTPVSTDPKTIIIDADSTKNVITFYYYKNVTLEANSATATYDGTPKSVSGYDCSVDGLTFEGITAGATGTLVGEYPATFNTNPEDPEFPKKQLDTTGNYIVAAVVPGLLTITDDPVDDANVITKKHGTEIDTDTAQSLYNLGETVTFTISVKNIYNTPKTITLTEKENVKFSNGENAIEFKDVPAGETVTAEATYTITSEDILAGGFTNTVTADFTGGGSWTAKDTVTTAELDTTLNVTKTSDVPEGQKAALGQTITYTIKVQNAGNVPYTNVVVEDPLTGLTETIETLPVGETQTFTTEYVVTEADVLKGFVLNTATAKGDKIKDPASDEKQKEPNGGDEVETPTFSPITIKPKDVTATYNGAAITGKDVEITSGKLLEGHKLSAAVIGSGVNAGSYELTLDPEKITIVDANNKDVSEMYARTILPGKLIINKRSVLITSQSATKTYDGSALTRPAVTITGDGFVPGELAKAEATGSITNVGSTPNAIQYTTTGAFNAANYSIALSVGTLTVTEKPKPEPRRTFNLTINYVYQNGKRAAASYNRGGLKNGETFDITSPVIAGYTASETVVSGTIYNRDIKVTVIYTADGVNLDDYGVPLGLGNITMNVGDCFE